MLPRCTHYLVLRHPCPNQRQVTKAMVIHAWSLCSLMPKDMRGMMRAVTHLCLKSPGGLDWQAEMHFDGSHHCMVHCCSAGSVELGGSCHLMGAQQEMQSCWRAGRKSRLHEGVLLVRQAGSCLEQAEDCCQPANWSRRPCCMHVTGTCTEQVQLHPT